MFRFFPTLLAATFAGVSTISTLVTQAQHPSSAPGGAVASTAQVALADQDDNNGRQGRNNGSRKCNGNGRNQGDQGDRDDRGRGRGRNANCGNANGNGGYGGSSLSGCVTSGVYNGNLVNLQTNGNGQVTVNEQQLINAGRGLGQGQCTTVRGYWSGNVFNATTGSGYGSGGYGNGVYGGNGGNYGRNGGGCRQSISGYVVMVNGTTVTINKGLITGTTQFDASPAMNAGNVNGNLSIGRRITACGYTDSGGFHAVSIS